MNRPSSNPQGGKQVPSVISRADEVDREMHEVEARNWCMAADREGADGNLEEAKAFAAVAQAHASVAFTQLYARSYS